MFKKFKEARANKKNKPIADMVTAQESAVRAIERKLVSAESIKDDAEKILKLQEVIEDIKDADRDSNYQQYIFVRDRKNKGGWKGAGAGTAVGAAAVAVPAALLCPPVVPIAIISGMIGFMGGGVTGETVSDKKASKKVAEEPYMSYFENILAAQENHAETLLSETEKNCDLNVIALSPHFKKVSRSSSTVHDRITEAAAEMARLALDGKGKPATKPKLIMSSTVGPILKK